MVNHHFFKFSIFSEASHAVVIINFTYHWSYFIQFNSFCVFYLIDEFICYLINSFMHSQTEQMWRPIYRKVAFILKSL